MAVGESQAWSWEASGWASRSCFVRFSYSFSALLMTSWKFDDEVVRLERDIRAELGEIEEFARAERTIADSWLGETS